MVQALNFNATVMQQDSQAETARFDLDGLNHGSRYDSRSGNLSSSSGPARCVVMFWVAGPQQLLVHCAHKAHSVERNVTHRPTAFLCSADSLQVLGDEQVLNGALAAVMATWLNYICLHKPFQHGNQIHSAGLRSALWLVSRGSSLQRSCTKLKYPLCEKSDTSAHQMMDGRKSTHTMGGNLVALSQTGSSVIWSCCITSVPIDSGFSSRLGLEAF